MMKIQLEALYAEKVHWAKIEQRALRMQKERDEEIQKRKTVESELDLSYAHIARLEKERDDVLQARAATEERMKDALGAALATTISVRSQSSVKLATMVADRRRLGPAGETIFREEEDEDGEEDHGGGFAATETLPGSADGGTVRSTTGKGLKTVRVEGPEVDDVDDSTTEM